MITKFHYEKKTFFFFFFYLNLWHEKKIKTYFSTIIIGQKKKNLFLYMEYYHLPLKQFLIILSTQSFDNVKELWVICASLAEITVRSPQC